MSLPPKDNHCSHLGMFLTGFFLKAIHFSEPKGDLEIMSPNPSFHKTVQGSERGRAFLEVTLPSGNGI